jgi:hypothetical protein
MSDATAGAVDVGFGLAWAWHRGNRIALELAQGRHWT